MKNVWMAMVVLGLAAPGLAVINVKVVADKTALAIGDQTTIRILAEGTDSGLGALGGSILATSPSVLETVPGSFQWSPAFRSVSPLLPVVGGEAAGGGWSGFGSMQTTYPSLETFARDAFVEVASYMVRAVPGAGLSTTLSFLPGKFGGYLPAEVRTPDDASAWADLGTFQGVTLMVPEPLSVMLLMVGGLAA
jgi:hypothetical protein